MSKRIPPPQGPEEIHDVSQSMFSIARYYGGIKFNGEQYVYDPTRDVLIRADILKARKQKPPEPRREIEHAWTLDSPDA